MERKLQYDNQNTLVGPGARGARPLLKTQRYFLGESVGFPGGG